MSVTPDGRVFDLFSDRSRWTNRHSAKDSSGSSMHAIISEERRVIRDNIDITPPVSFEESVSDSRAVCWCLVGGIYKCYGPDAPEVYKTVENYCFQTKLRSPASLNDINGYEAVLQVCKELNL